MPTGNAEILSQSPAVITNQAFDTIAVPITVSLSLLAETITLFVSFKLPVSCSRLFAAIWFVLSKLGLELSWAVVFSTNQVIGAFVIIVTVALTNIARLFLCATVPGELVPSFVVACSFATGRLAIVEIQVGLELGRRALVPTKRRRNAGASPVPLTPSVAVSGGAFSPWSPLGQLSMCCFWTCFAEIFSNPPSASQIRPSSQSSSESQSPSPI